MIKLDNVTKYFKTDGEKKYILKNVSLTIPYGVNLGILGRNGAGKSTLLRMLGGIDFPTAGTISSSKTFSWPMGLGGGFQGAMTGRQNVKFVCRIYGKTKEEIDVIIDSVQEFAEIGEYFDLPIQIYSSGMRGRLSFGLSLAFDFEYLIIDETLSTGDENFKVKATAALEDKIKNCNILLVSHSMDTLKRLCSAGILVDDGKIYYYEDIEDAVEAYKNVNATLPLADQDKHLVGNIHSSDGNSFENINEMAKFYNVRPMSILQALNDNAGSNIYLKKVFWRENENKLPFQDWQYAEKETIISTDGIIFENYAQASSFYMNRLPNARIDNMYVETVMKDREGIAKELNVEFYYLSEYK